MTMRIDNKDLKVIEARLKTYMDRKVARNVGTVAVDTFKGSFRRQGWIENRAVEKWPARKSPGRSRRGRSRRGILIASGYLRRSIQKRVRDKSRVEVSTDAPYAKAHNEGETIRQEITITKKMRAFFWARYYESQDEKWKAMALMKGPIRREIIMPRRQFMGVSPFLEDRILKNIEKDLEEIFKTALKN